MSARVGRAPGGALATTAAATSGAGAALVATAAAACCSTPALAVLTVSLLGASGAAWAAGMKPYTPWLLAASAIAIGYGFWTRRRAVRTCAADGARAARGFRDRLVGATLWLATLVWLVALVVNLFYRLGIRWP